MSRAWLTFHPLMSWFIAEAWRNIFWKLVTCPTCHEPRGWLKAVAELNILCAAPAHTRTACVRPPE
eukprot:scaffold92693_cov61-Phaeocystis_antarctica.AAC.2